jgi:hypothetical protein
VIFRLHLSGKEDQKTAKDILPAIRQCALKKSEIYQHLKHEASKNCPSPMMVQWKKFIWKV